MDPHAYVVRGRPLPTADEVLVDTRTGGRSIPPRGDGLTVPLSRHSSDSSKYRPYTGEGLHDGPHPDVVLWTRRPTRISPTQLPRRERSLCPWGPSSSFSPRTALDHPDSTRTEGPKTPPPVRPRQKDPLAPPMSRHGTCTPPEPVVTCLGTVSGRPLSGGSGGLRHRRSLGLEATQKAFGERTTFWVCTSIPLLVRILRRDKGARGHSHN